MDKKIMVKFANWIADNWIPNGRVGCWDSVELNTNLESKYLVDSTEDLLEIFLKEEEVEL